MVVKPLYHEFSDSNDAVAWNSSGQGHCGKRRYSVIDQSPPTQIFTFPPTFPRTPTFSNSSS